MMVAASQIEKGNWLPAVPCVSTKGQTMLVTLGKSFGNGG